MVTGRSRKRGDMSRERGIGSSAGVGCRGGANVSVNGVITTDSAVIVYGAGPPHDEVSYNSCNKFQFFLFCYQYIYLIRC